MGRCPTPYAARRVGCSCLCAATTTPTTLSLHHRQLENGILFAKVAVIRSASSPVLKGVSNGAQLLVSADKRDRAADTRSRCVHEDHDSTGLNGRRTSQRGLWRPWHVEACTPQSVWQRWDCCWRPLAVWRTRRLHPHRHLYPRRLCYRHLYPRRPSRRHLYPWRPSRRHLYPRRPSRRHLYPRRPCHRHLYPRRPCHRHLYPRRPCHRHLYPRRPCHRHLYPRRPCHLGSLMVRITVRTRRPSRAARLLSSLMVRLCHVAALPPRPLHPFRLPGLGAARSLHPTGLRTALISCSAMKEGSTSLMQAAQISSLYQVPLNLLDLGTGTFLLPLGTSLLPFRLTAPWSRTRRSDTRAILMR